MKNIQNIPWFNEFLGVVMSLLIGFIPISDAGGSTCTLGGFLFINGCCFCTVGNFKFYIFFTVLYTKVLLHLVAKINKQMFEQVSFFRTPDVICFLHWFLYCKISKYVGKQDNFELFFIFYFFSSVFLCLSMYLNPFKI